MAVTGREAPVTYAAPTTYAERGMEVLWLLTAALVPLIFVPTDYMLSEAVNAYVEVPKTTALRTLAGLMAILWIVEWVLKGGLSRRYSLANYPTRLKNWVVEQPSRWVVVAATVYVVVTIVTTFLSVSFWISMWGEVSGQFGYSAYTTVSYFLVFAVVATHLKTQDQLWRLLGVIVAMGALVALYGMVQHYGIDPLNLGETGSARVTATMANPVFTGAVLVVTALMTVGTGLLVLDRMGWKPVRVCLWVLLISAQFMVVFWTGSRGSFLLGVPIGLIAFLVLAPFAFAPRNFGSPLKTILRLVSGAVTAGFAFERRIFTKTFLVIASGLLITLAVVAFTPSPSDKSVGDVDASTVAVGQVEERLASIKATAVRGGVSYRTDIWEGALGLVVRRPWFAYENLSISFLRPLVGYGPELFKYTFPLESPLGGLLSQAHNFWVHHWVEQGLLGLFSSLGLFVALFIVGVAQLWRNREVYSTTHKWILVTLLATVAGRGAEMMVGVARESDLVLFWIILAIFVALPSVMSPSRESQATPVPERPLRLAGRRERRGGRLGRRDRSGRRTSGESGGQMGVPLGIGLVLVSAVIIFIGWLTWDKNVDYAWAAVLAASARDQFREGDFQESQRLMSKAVAKAPDVPMYYHNLAGIYDAYKEIATNDPERTVATM